MEILTIKEAEELGEKHYKQHNAITSGRYDFTSCQLDILFMILAKLKDNETDYSIHTNDIELITGRKWNISQLTASTEQLLTRMFEIATPQAYKQFVLFQHFEFLKGTRTIKVRLSQTALPYFFELRNNFTHFQLKSVLGCTSKFAKRLYMLACQWKVVGRFPKPIPIAELKKMLSLIDNDGVEQFKQIGEFKAGVLDIAKKQINEQTDISFDYELIKRGRSFEYIQIHVSTSKEEPKQLSIDFKEPIDYQKNVRTIMAYGISEDYAILIVKHGMDKFTEYVKAVNLRAQQGKLNVENAAAYIIGSYQKKGIIPKT